MKPRQNHLNEINSVFWYLLLTKRNKFCAIIKLTTAFGISGFRKQNIFGLISDYDYMTCEDCNKTFFISRFYERPYIPEVFAAML